jgi:hypothetical protein
MNLRKQIAVISLSLFTITSLASGQTNSQTCANSQSIVGTWVVTRHGADCSTGNQLGPDFPALMTFNQGGTLNAYAIPPNGSTPANSSPEYGTWFKTGPHSYRFRDISFGYDGNGAFTGSAIVKAVVTLDGNADSFTYKATIDFYDASGKLLFSICGGATGKRF